MFAFALFIGAGLIGNPWYRIVSVDGGSMEPTIARGSLIVVAPTPARIGPGAIVVLQVGERLVTHRVVGINLDGSVVTRGDANTVNDSWSGQSARVQGWYVATIPWLGNVVHLGAQSAALFSDAVTSTSDIKVGPWTSPDRPDKPDESSSPAPSALAPSDAPASQSPAETPIADPTDEPTATLTAAPTIDATPNATVDAQP